MEQRAVSIPGSVSLFTGGLIFRLLRRMRLHGTLIQRVRAASILVVPLVAWLPLLALSAMSGTLVKANTGVSFLDDVGVHVRFLVVLPLLLLAGRVAERRMGPTLQQFVSRHLVPAEKIDEFKAAVGSAYRLGDSVVADIVIIVLILGADALIAARADNLLSASRWYVNPSSQGGGLTAAGMWYAYVSLPIFQFVLLRWYYRLFVWARFLRKVSRLNLQLVATHPDRLGGLGFVIVATQALFLFAMAHGALLGGFIASRVLFRGVPLTDFKGEAALIVVFVICITVAPLLAFARPLVLTKRRGTILYGELASHYVSDFETKWLGSGEERNDELIGSADIQSLADMGGSYELVRTMRSFPITPQLVIGFVIATLLPASPLLLTVMPLSELIKKLAGILF